MQREYPFNIAKRRGINPDGLAHYLAEAQTLGDSGLHRLLDSGRRWSEPLAATLARKGAVLFPHTYLSQCGHQIAAAVHAALDSGADQVLALGVFHPNAEELWTARQRELDGAAIGDEPSWGILGPDFAGYDGWRHEFSLTFFKLLWRKEIERRGCPAPRLIERYPSLANRRPDLLPGIEELSSIARDSALIVSDDLLHHGVAYGVAADKAYGLDDKGLSFARERIAAGLRLLEAGDYAAYYEHGMDPTAIGDPSDASAVMRHLLGPMKAEIVDIKLVDVSGLFAGAPRPSWVATSLVAAQPTK